MPSAARWHATLAALILAALPHPGFGQNSPSFALPATPLECQVDGKQTNFSYVVAQGWIPSATHEIHGILCVVIHPHQSRASTLQEPSQWKRLAEKHHCALIAISFVEPTDPGKNWIHARRGSGDALWKVIRAFAGQSRRADLDRAPVFLTGVCAAGLFSAEFAAAYPEKAKGFTSIGGSLYRPILAPAAARLPAIIVGTPDRGPIAMDNARDFMARGSSRNAPWIWLQEPVAIYDRGHVTMRYAAALDDILSASFSGKSPLASRLLHPHLENDAPGLFPLSYLGTPLPAIATLSGQSPTIEFSRGNSSGFQLKVDPSLHIDDIRISAPGLDRYAARPMENGIWHVDFSLDPLAFPSGTSSVEIPVRFFSRHAQVPGGLNILAKVIAKGDIYPSPATLTLASRDGLHAGKIQLLSRSGSPVTDIAIEKIVPPGMRASVEHLGSTPAISLEMPSPEDHKPFVGYIIITAKTGKPQKIRIPLYGKNSQ